MFVIVAAITGIVMPVSDLRRNHRRLNLRRLGMPHIGMEQYSGFHSFQVGGVTGMPTLDRRRNLLLLVLPVSNMAILPPNNL